jgi:sulfur transfer complex TusBCD TusB component (DsrH family)
MFASLRKQRTDSKAHQIFTHAIMVALEPLEDRRLLSASHGGHFGEHGFGGGPAGHGGSTIEFSLAPTVVQTGLNTLATADGLTDPTSTQRVVLNNVNGVETYSVTLNGTGTVSTLTVDQLGDPVTAPTNTTTTWATLSGTGTGSDSAAAAEISAIATALSLAAPASTDTVNISTTSAGAVTYSIQLSSSSTSTTSEDYGHNFGATVTVDSAGNPVGHQQLPFSVFSTTIQNALNAHAPTGAIALASTSTQSVDVDTTDGITTYSTIFTVTGTQTTVTVNSAGTLTSLPATTTTTFSALSSAVQTELQTLATADGVTTAIASTQTINVLTETNGTILYSATLSATGTDNSGSTYTFDVTVTVDSSGNPTTLPQDGGLFGYGGSGFGGGGGDCWPGMGNGNAGGSTSNSSSGSTSNSSSSTIALPGSGDSSTLNTSSIASYVLDAKLLLAATNGLGMLGGYFIEFAPATVNAAIKTDLTTIASAEAQLATDTKALTSAEKTTLKTDTKAIQTAIKAISSTLIPLESALKTDVSNWKTTLKTDTAAIRKDKNNATALATAKTHLATDEASAFAAIAKDQEAIQTAINSASGVVAAQAQLTTDLPTIAADQSAIQADQSQLVTDIEAQLSAT